jgi:hypothetical protein
VNSKSKENKKGRSYFVEDQKEMKEEKQCAWDQIKEKWDKKKKGSEGRGVIFGLLFLTLAAPYKKGAFLL